MINSRAFSENPNLVYRTVSRANVKVQTMHLYQLSSLKRFSMVLDVVAASIKLAFAETVIMRRRKKKSCMRPAESHPLRSM